MSAAGPTARGAGAADGPAMRFVRLVDASAGQIAAFHAIYHEALPDSERKPDEAIAALAGRGDYVVELAERGGMIVGFLILYLSAACPMALLEYVGISATQRNGGLGGQLFARAAALAAGRTMLLEVESDRAGDAGGADLRARRKGFYARHGCRQLAGVDYIMPHIGAQKPPAMDLLAFTSLDRVARDTLRAWLADVYRHVYARGPDDPAIDAMVANLPREVMLRTI